jgi:hypothetical protein
MDKLDIESLLKQSDEYICGFLDAFAYTRADLHASKLELIAALKAQHRMEA